MSTYLLGLDAGGRSIRCSLVDVETGRVTAAARPWAPLPDFQAGFFAFSLDMDRCWRLTAETVRETLQKAHAEPEEVLGIAVTSMRFSLVLSHADGRGLFATPNRDARATAEGIRLAEERGSLINTRTGHWPSPIFMAPRLQWLNANAPDILMAATSAFSLGDWLGQKFTGQVATDVSQAGETLLFDLTAQDWAWDLIDELDLPRRLFPPVLAAGTPLGSLTGYAAEALGLRPGTPVAVGGADTQCGLLGAGVVRPGTLAVVAGSTTPLHLVTAGPLVDAGARVWAGRHVVPGLWVLESNAGAMGDTLEWVAGVLFPEAAAPVSRLIAEASTAAPGAGGILSSLGAEVMNAQDMSLPLGTLSLSLLDSKDAQTHRSNLCRAVLEGMAFAVRANAEQILKIAAATRVETVLVGGMTRSRLWAQIVADALDSPVAVSVEPGASATGAAICAGTGAGLFTDLAQGADTLAHTQEVLPEEENARTYSELYQHWSRVRSARAPADALAVNVALQALMSGPEQHTHGQETPPKLRILATADLDETSIAELRSLGRVDYASYRDALRLLTDEQLVEELQGYNVFITEVDVVDLESVRSLPHLRVIAACRGQAVNVDMAACTALGIPVLFAPGRNAEAVADLTLAFILTLARKLVDANAFLRRPGGEPGDMGRMGQAHAELHGHELWCKTVGLVGLGAVGRAVARRLRPFGARVVVWDPNVTSDEACLADAELVTLGELLEKSDVVSLHAPVTEATRGMIGQHELARMKRGAFLINTARAALVQEDALFKALHSGHLGGAALDVFAQEPPGADHPLLGLPNVVATPHLGGNTTEVGAHQGGIVAEDLKRMVAGEPPLHVLNPETLATFSSHAERRPLDPGILAELAALAAGSGPAVSDLQLETDPQTGQESASPVEPAVGPGGASIASAAEPTNTAEGAGTEMADQRPVVSPKSQMEHVLGLFVASAVTDAALSEAAAKRSVNFHYFANDLGLEFYVGFRDGKVIAGLGAPGEPAEVKLKAKAETLDGILTGRISGNKAAMTGRLSFSGDVRLAMSMQRVQGDLVRLYSAARAEAGDIDFSQAEPAAPAPVPAAAPAHTVAAAMRPAPSAAPGLREELTRAAQEMFTAQLLTATGGNVSLRIPGMEEAWITPSQLFKGELTPDMMVRIDFEGNSLDPDAPAPSSERLAHCEIYRARPDVEAVVHAHATYATIMVLSGLPFLPVTTEAAFLADIPRVPFTMPGTKELAVAVRQALGNGTAVLMQNHGLIVAASSLRHAVNTAEVIERVAELIWGCYAVGKKPPTLPKDVLAMLREIGQMIA